MGRRTQNKKTTIVDIAEASGVSVSTVSRILNNKPDVAEETRRRVLEVIEAHRFAPQTAWQQLRSGKSRVISLHFPQDFNPPAHHIITGAALRCAAAGYSLNLVAATLTEPELLAIYESGQADGMILMEILTHDWRPELLRQQGYPFVMIGHCADNTGLSYVDLDIAGGIRAGVAHLVALGHRRIGCITIAPVLQRREYGYATSALAGYRAACAEFGIEPVWRAVDLRSNNVQNVVAELLATDPTLTALLTPQDAGVGGIYRAAQAAGRRIPDDLSVIGLINDSVADFITPPLTGIDFPARTMGEEAARILIGQLEGELQDVQQLLLPARLCPGGSVAPNNPH